MPTYEYACSSCGQHIEVFQRFSDQPLTECGVCGGPLRKVFHPAGILFKGSGFYSTDSRSSRTTSTKEGKAGEPAKAGAASREGSTAAGSGSGSSSGSEGPTQGSAGTKEKSA